MNTGINIAVRNALIAKKCFPPLFSAACGFNADGGSLRESVYSPAAAVYACISQIYEAKEAPASPLNEGCRLNNRERYLWIY